MAPMTSQMFILEPWCSLSFLNSKIIRTRAFFSSLVSRNSPMVGPS